MSDAAPRANDHLTELANLLNRFTVDLTVVVDEHIGTEYGGNAELKAIVALHRMGSHTRAALAETAGLSPRAITRLVQRMQRRGIVETTTDPADRRTVVISPTRKGRRAFRALAHALDELYANTQPLSKGIVDLLTTAGDREGTTSPSDPFEMLDRLADLGLALQAAIGAHPRGGEVGGRQQLAILRLAEIGSTRPTELAEFLGMTSGGLTYVVNQLEDRRLVHREYGAGHDRRAVEIVLTNDGRIVADAILQGVGNTTPQLVETFSQLRDRSLTWH